MVSATSSKLFFLKLFLCAVYKKKIGHSEFIYQTGDGPVRPNHSPPRQLIHRKQKEDII